jgi:hypothetical protein
MIAYDDRPVGYPTVETKIKNTTDLTTLYYLNEWQKSFTTRITFKAELIDTFNINIAYVVPDKVNLIMNFDPNSFNEEINKALLEKPVDCIITHLIVMKTIMEELNSRSIGICLDKEVEDIMMKRIHNIETLYEVHRWTENYVQN